MHLKAARSLLPVILFFLFLGGSAPTAWGPTDIRHVHVIFSNHLDVGFDGLGPTEMGFAFTVMNKYFDEYFPRGINTSLALRQNDPPYHYVYTTQAFLASFYLDCIIPSRWQYPPPGMQPNGPRPPLLHCPDSPAQQAFVDAVKRGDITWHAFPFNSEPELYDSSLFQSSVNLARDLAMSLGRPAPRTLSQRDVPGMTRGVIPLLTELGVDAISVGVNGGSSPPAAPSAFVWRDAVSGKEVIGMYHPGGYGGIEVSDCVIVPGLDHALALAWKGDNQGPHTVDEALAVFKQLQLEFPNAVVQGSTFDAFVDQLKTVKSSLPVIQSEIGDTWIHGVASDPLKLAQFREVLRQRRACLAERRCSSSDDAFRQFNRILTKVGEHTWGVDVKTFLLDFTHWSNVEFEAVKTRSNFELMVNSWIEQRSFITNALLALASSDKYAPLAQHIDASLQALKPTGPPNPRALGYSPVAIEDWSRIFQCGELVLGFDATNGAINYLYDKTKRAQWANGAARHSLGLFQYTTFDHNDFDSYIDTYGYLQPPPGWFEGDFGKPNLQLGKPQHGHWLPKLEAMWSKTSQAGWHFLMQLSMANETWKLYGAAPAMWLQIDVSADTSGGRSLNYTFTAFNKTSTRLPEAHWFSFVPSVPVKGRWLLSKLGSPIDISDVLHNGSFHLHVVDDNGVFFIDSGANGASLQITSLDAGLVSAGSPNPFPIPFKPADIDAGGLHFNLYNNIWGTNYIMWYPYVAGDADLQYRFKLTFK